MQVYQGDGYEFTFPILQWIVDAGLADQFVADVEREASKCMTREYFAGGVTIPQFEPIGIVESLRNPLLDKRCACGAVSKYEYRFCPFCGRWFVERK